jgi:hypothetical protein
MHEFQLLPRGLYDRVNTTHLKKVSIPTQGELFQAVYANHTTDVPLGMRADLHSAVYDVFTHPEAYGVQYVHEIWFMAHNFPVCVVSIEKDAPSKRHFLIVDLDKPQYGYMKYISDDLKYVFAFMLVVLATFCMR